MLTVAGAKLVTLVLNALHGLLVFYEKDYKQVNVDGLFGLRVMEGQLKHMWTSLESSDQSGIPADIIKDIKYLSINAGLLANKAIPHVYNSEPDYFKQFKYLVHRPYDILHEHQLTDPKLLWPKSHKKPRGLTEAESDRCMTEMLKAVATREENMLIEDPLAPADIPAVERVLSRRKRAPIPGKGGPGCGLSKDCLSLMLNNTGTSSYALTHQILYVSVGELTSCTRDMNDYLISSRQYTNGVDGFLAEHCANLLKQIQSLANEKAGNLVGIQRDLFMEQVFTCGQFGFVEFVQLDWLEWILNWQDSSGCFAESEFWPNETDWNNGGFVIKRKAANSEIRPGTRKLMVEMKLKDDCFSHASAVAVGGLVIYLRFLLDPGPKEWSHLRLDLQRNAFKLKSRHENLFKAFDMSSWKLLSSNEVKLDAYEDFGGLPPGREVDVTAIFAILLFVLFAYASWRLFCRRKRGIYPFAFKRL